MFYSHCGKLGTKRTITIKEGATVLKQWQFSDAGSSKFMSVKAKEILAFQNKKDDRQLKLYYASAEMPEGKVLASINLNTELHKAIP